MQTYEKLILVGVAILGVICLSAQAGPTNLKNEQAVAVRKAEVSVKLDPDYLSDEAYSAELAAANSVAKLQAVLIKKDKSDKAKAKALKESIEKVKTKGVK